MSGAATLSALRRFARGRPAERCDFCGAEVGRDHEHLLDVERRDVRCACEACDVLVPAPAGAPWRRIRRRAERMADFRLGDARWDSFDIPIGLAFFVRHGADGRVAAFYPSPAGLTESRLALDAWDALVADNPVLGDLEPDVEALLVNRLGHAREHYRLSIDECFRLAGLLRTRRQGAADMADEVRRFLDGLGAGHGRD